MKKLLVAAALVAFAHTASAAILGTAHDLSATGPRATKGTKSSCMYCHNAHKTAGIAAAPLWNRSMSTQTFTQLSARDNGTTRTLTGGATMTCLSCHDGTIDLGTLLNNSDITLGKVTTGLIGAAGNLNADHPVGVGYTAATTTGAMLKDPATAATALSTTAAKLATLECSGCHDPHGLGTNTKFLRSAISGICAVCHAK